MREERGAQRGCNELAAVIAATSLRRALVDCGCRAQCCVSS